MQTLNLSHLIPHTLDFSFRTSLALNLSPSVPLNVHFPWTYVLRPLCCGKRLRMALRAAGEESWETCYAPTTPWTLSCPVLSCQVMPLHYCMLVWALLVTTSSLWL